MIAICLGRAWSQRMGRDRIGLSHSDVRCQLFRPLNMTHMRKSWYQRGSHSSGPFRFAVITMKSDDSRSSWNWKAVFSQQSVILLDRLYRRSATVTAVAVHMEQPAALHNFHKRGLAWISRIESPRNHVIFRFFEFVCFVVIDTQAGGSVIKQLVRMGRVKFQAHP